MNFNPKEEKQLTLFEKMQAEDEEHGKSILQF